MSTAFRLRSAQNQKRKVTTSTSAVCPGPTVQVGVAQPITVDTRCTQRWRDVGRHDLRPADRRQPVRSGIGAPRGGDSPSRRALNPLGGPTGHVHLPGMPVISNVPARAVSRSATRPRSWWTGGTNRAVDALTCADAQRAQIRLAPRPHWADAGLVTTDHTCRLHRDAQSEVFEEPFSPD